MATYITIGSIIMMVIITFIVVGRKDVELAKNAVKNALDLYNKRPIATVLYLSMYTVLCVIIWPIIILANIYVGIGMIRRSKNN